MEAPITDAEIAEKIQEYTSEFNISEQDARYFIGSDAISSNTYKMRDDKINILYNDGEIKDLASASDMFDLSVLSKEVRKYFFCYLKKT